MGFCGAAAKPPPRKTHTKIPLPAGAVGADDSSALNGEGGEGGGASLPHPGVLPRRMKIRLFQQPPPETVGQ